MSDQRDHLPILGISTTHHLMDLAQERRKTAPLLMMIRMLERRRRHQRLMKYVNQPGFVLEPHGVFAAAHSSRHTANTFIKDLVAEPTHLWIGPLVHARTESRVFIDDRVTNES